MGKARLSIYTEEEIITQIEELAEERDESRNAIVTDLLSQALGIESGNSDSSGLEEKVSRNAEFIERNQSRIEELEDFVEMAREYQVLDQAKRGR